VRGIRPEGLFNSLRAGMNDALQPVDRPNRSALTPIIRRVHEIGLLMAGSSSGPG
jgi:hypothetical protein